MKGPEADDEEAGGPSWKRFIASEGGFQVDLPSDPARQDATVKTGVGSVKIHGFRAEHDVIVFLGTYSECSARLSLLEYVKILDAPLDLWVPGAGRRKSLGERLLPRGGPRGPREEDFSLPSRKGGVKWIARRRWMERQGHFYQAIAVLPVSQAASAHVARFLESLEPIPIAVDRRGLTPAWKRPRSKNDGFSALWPERFDDPLIRVVKTPTRSLAYSTSFVFQRRMGFAVMMIRTGGMLRRPPM
jgi:hypothetical protein